MKSVTIQAFKEILDLEKNNKDVAFINVCTPTEYKEKHIPGVKNIPLDELELRINELKNKTKIYVHCISGRRSSRAIEKLSELNIDADLVNVEGGILAWEGINLPTKSIGKRLPIIRQVMISAGFLVFLGIALSFTVHPYFLFLSAFIGGGLIFAGITGWCGMAVLLSKMPWNK